MTTTPKMTEQNFTFYINHFRVAMTDGRLTINGVEHFHYDKHSALYAFAIWIAKAQGLI